MAQTRAQLLKNLKKARAARGKGKKAKVPAINKVDKLTPGDNLDPNTGLPVTPSPVATKKAKRPAAGRRKGTIPPALRPYLFKKKGAKKSAGK